MSLLVSWLVFPLLLGAAALGCGLLVERASRERLPGVLLLPLGLAGVVVITQITTFWDSTAELATPAVIVAAVAGMVVSRERLRALAPDRWAAAAGVGVFAAFGAPVLLSGDATFAGYILNGEPSIHFIGMDRLMEHGRSLEGLAPSSYEFCLKAFFGNGYPSGSQTALGGIRPLVGQDVAWIYQSFIAVIVAMVPLALYSMLTPHVERRSHRALVAFVVSQPALVYAFSLQGSVKELSALWVITLLAALVPWFLSRRDSLGAVVPVAVAAAAGLAVINLAIAPWLGLILLACFVGTLWGRARSHWRHVAAQAAIFAVLTAAMSFPALSVADSLVAAAERQLTQQEDLTAASGLGNLLGPLHKEQVFGIWLNGDYRKQPTGRNDELTNLLLAVALASGAIGALWALRRRALGPLAYMTVSAIAAAYVVRRGSPWGDAKALMITSPAALLAIALGPVALLAARRRWIRLAGLAAAAAIGFGVLWSNALAYHDVNLAPRDRLNALADVGDRISGQGPTLYTEFEEFGKHFLRDADPEGRSEGCQRRFVPLRDGSAPQQGFTYDLDRQTLDYLLFYRTIVLRRSPSSSRPPAGYERTFQNSYYEVWQRPARPPMTVVEHVPIGNQFDPTAKPSCDDAAAIGRRARDIPGARIAYAPRPPPAILQATATRHPRDWIRDQSEAHVLIPTSPGRVEGALRAPSAGRYTLWLGGSFGRGYEVSLDGRRLDEVRYRLNGRDEYERVADVDLSGGEHRVTLVRGGGSPRPGNGGLIRSLGPIVLEPAAAQRRTVRFLDPGDWRRLCTLDADWIEIVRPAGTREA